MIDVAVIIVSWNVRQYLANCLRSVYAEIGRSRFRSEVWVVDNASTDGTVELVADLYPQTHLLLNERNVGFGAANNQGMEAAVEREPRYFFLLNPDTELGRQSLDHLVTFMDENPRVGMTTSRLVYGDGRFQHSAFLFPGLRQLLFDLFPMPDRFYESRLNGRYPRRFYRRGGEPFPIDHPLGATMLVRADVAEVTDGFDESYHMYCEEIDWSWRIQEAGWEIYAVPAAEIVHYGGESTRQIPAQSVLNLWRSRAQFYHQHHGPLKARLATRLVAAGMQRKAQAAADPELAQAYRQVVDIWRSANGRN